MVSHRKTKEHKSFFNDLPEEAKRKFDAEFFNSNDNDDDDDDFLASLDLYSSSWQPHPSP